MQFLARVLIKEVFDYLIGRGQAFCSTPNAMLLLVIKLQLNLNHPLRKVTPLKFGSQDENEAIPREAMHHQQALEIGEEERNFQVDQSKLYQKGDPGMMQGIVKDIITVVYFMSLPDGREGFLPCMRLGCIGGIALLTRLFKLGDEITV
ncbi:hypothetical protein L7F22_001133 [Adiantum nelumboides]|nr:hypothetical protein [Adiantum nelumboides]